MLTVVSKQLKEHSITHTVFDSANSINVFYYYYYYYYYIIIIIKKNTHKQMSFLNCGSRQRFPRPQIS